MQQALPDFTGQPKLTLTAPAGLGGTLEIQPRTAERDQGGAQSRGQQVQADRRHQHHARLVGSAGVGVFVPIAPPGRGAGERRPTSWASISKRSKSGGALVIGSDELGVKLAIGELGVALRLKNGAPRAAVLRARRQGDDQAAATPSSSSILGDGIKLGLDVDAEADVAGRAAPRQRHRPAREPAGADAADRPLRAAVDQPRSRSDRRQLRASEGRALCVVRRLARTRSRRRSIAWASCSTLDVVNAGDRSASRSSRRTASASSLDAGIVKGGGYLAVDENGYAGVLELKMLAVDVKAIALLNTHSEAGFSLLLLIFGQFPAIQLSFGFTLTGIGGLIGVQHTASPTALSQGSATAQLDAVLFPDESGRQRAAASSTRCARCFRSRAADSSSGRCSSSAGARRASSPCGSACSIEAEPVRAARPGDRRSSRRSSRPTSRCCTCGSTSSARSSSIRCASRSTRSSIQLARRVHHRSPGSSRSARSSATSRRSSSAPAASTRASRRFPPTSRRPSIASARASTSASSACRSRAISRSPRRRYRRARRCARGPTSASPASRAASASTRSAISCRSSTSSWTCFAYLAVHVFGIDFASMHLTALLAGPGRWHIAGNARSAHAVAAARLLAAHRRELGHRSRHAADHRQRRRTSWRRRSRRSRNWCAQLPQGGESFLTLADIEAGDRRARASARHTRLPAEARAVRAAHGQGERQQDRAARTSSSAARCS